MDDKRRPRLDPTLQRVQTKVDPPPELIAILATGERPCGAGRFVFTWQRGVLKGLPVTTYCTEPLCLDQDPPECTGPRFVPHNEQYDLAPKDPRRVLRVVSIEEAVEASKVSAELARHQTGRHDDRSDEQIANHIKAHRAVSTETVSQGGSWSTAPALKDLT